MVHAACIIAVSSPPPRVTPNARAQADDFLSYSKQRFLHSLQKFSGLLFSAKTRRESLRPITQVRTGQIRSGQDHRWNISRRFSIYFAFLLFSPNHISPFSKFSNLLLLVKIE
ncbi:hypothetical protein AVEN_274405-1 [Araneus ventricosus]|uniref:Uncharacterized protein n=1 Tax=Araneus ventricosus TaxID=182803 RepID=A0A4Y2E4C4_ARAVE|nr:hypothetical protein AVEN_274405-1 [Araneus ventricosus]